MNNNQTPRRNRIILSIAMITGLAILMSLPSITKNPLSAQEIISKIGSRCPNNYAPDGSYCKPLQGAKEIITRIGNRCPKGFAPDGAYCYRFQSKPSKVMPKSGSRCPTGFVPDGDYCISLN